MNEQWIPWMQMLTGRFYINYHANYNSIYAAKKFVYMQAETAFGVMCFS